MEQKIQPLIDLGLSPGTIEAVKIQMAVAGPLFTTSEISKHFHRDVKCLIHLYHNKEDKLLKVRSLDIIDLGSPIAPGSVIGGIDAGELEKEMRKINWNAPAFHPAYPAAFGRDLKLEKRATRIENKLIALSGSGIDGQMAAHRLKLKYLNDTFYSVAGGLQTEKVLHYKSFFNVLTLRHRQPGILPVKKAAALLIKKGCSNRCNTWKLLSETARRVLAEEKKRRLSSQRIIGDIIKSSGNRIK